jgi:hypothetical protein
VIYEELHNSYQYRLRQNHEGAFLASPFFFSKQTALDYKMSADPNAPSALDLDDEPYESAEDQDFQLDPAQDESELSSSEDEAAEPAKKKRKTDKKAEIVTEELDSGDEATIQKARDKRNKSKKKMGKGKNAVDEKDLDFDEDEGGAGGFVRTRAMKKHM